VFEFFKSLGWCFFFVWNMHLIELSAFLQMQTRRSMQFAKHLCDIGDNFRRTHLDSDDIRDKTLLDEDWSKMEVCFII